MRKILLILMTFSLFGFTLIGNKGTVSPTYLLSEGFEGTGYENTGWSESGTGILNEDYTSNCFSGSHCLFSDVTVSNAVTDTKTFSVSNEVWIYFTLYVETYSNSTSPSTLMELRSDSAAILELKIINGVWYLVSGVVESAVAGVTPTQGNRYHIWVRYKKGTGTNAEGDLWVCDDSVCSGVRPAFPSASFATGTTTTQASRFSLRNTLAMHNWIYDKVRIDDVSIENNPQ